jgi:preprotein translocase subunit SecG
MLDKILFWVVLVWMIVMLVLAIIAVREVWKEAGQPETEGEPPDGAPPAKGEIDPTTPTA